MKILLIGAGGVSSYLLPLLKITHRDAEVVIMDKDVLERRNLDRQNFESQYVGMHKAESLAKMHGYQYVNEWFVDQPTDSMDLVICCADNHVARKNCLEATDTYLTPCIIGGNEYFDSEAYIYYPSFKDSDKDPRNRYPEILTNKAGNPASCNSVEALEATPQLAQANASCATLIMHLLWNHTHSKADIQVRPYELVKSQYFMEALS